MIRNELDSGLKRFISARVRDPEAAEDLLQDVYVKVQSSIGSLRDRDRLRPWVYRIARNAVTDYYRRQRTVNEPVETTYVDADPLDEQMAQALLESVRAMILCLPKPYRETLILTEYQGLTQAQLAQRLGISVSGAKSRVQRARSRLKEMLLDCCHFELDRAGRVMNFYPREDKCSCGRTNTECC